jgi:ankyrin repeat protein
MAALAMREIAQRLKAEREALTRRGPQESGVTEMHTAALKGDLQALVDALQKGGSPNSRCVRNVTPLHLACKGGHLAAVQLLVKHGAEVSARSTQGVTPLQVALKHGQSEIVRYLRDIQCSDAVRASLSELPSAAVRKTVAGSASRTDRQKAGAGSSLQSLAFLTFFEHIVDEIFDLDDFV